MGFGVIEGKNEVKRFDIGTSALEVGSSEALEDVTVIGDRFSVGDLGNHLAMIHILPGSPTNQNGYTLQLYNVTAGSVADSETREYADGGMQVFLFTFNVTNTADLYEIRIVISGGYGNTFKINLSPLVFKMVILPFGVPSAGTITGSGTANYIPKWTAGLVIGNSTITDDGTTVAINTSLSVTATQTRLGVASSLTGSLVYANATNANTVTIQSGVTAASYVLTLPLAQSGAGQVLSNDGTGVLSWVTPVLGSGSTNALAKFTAATTVGDSTITDDGTTVAINTSLSVTATQTRLGVASSLAGSLIYANATNANTVTIQSGVTSTSYTLTLPLAQSGAGQVLSNDGTGVLSWVTPVLGSGSTNALAKFTAATTVGDSTITDDGTTVAINTSLSVTATQTRLGVASSLAGSLIYANATNANTVTIQSGVTSASYTLTLPLAQGGANTFLRNDGSGVMSWAAGGASGTGTLNVVPKITNATGPVYGDSGITDDGTTITTSEIIQINSNTSQIKFGTSYNVGIGYKAANVLGVTDGSTSDALRISAGGLIYGNAVANPIANGVNAAVRLTNVVTITTTAAHNLVAGQVVTLAGFTMTTDAINGTWVIATVPTTATFTIASAGANETSNTTTGTITPLAKVTLGTTPVGSATTTYPVDVEGIGFSAGTLLRAPPTQAVTSTAGNAVTIQASPAIAGTSTAGAAAGGSVNITAGAAARKDSGNAAGGDIILTPGAGIGTGKRGTVQCPGAGGSSMAIGSGSIASGALSTAIGNTATASDGGATAIGWGATASAIGSCAITGTGVGAMASKARLTQTCNISLINVIRKDNAEEFNSGSTNISCFAGSPSYLFSNELDTTQAALANASQNWAITVSSNVVIVDTIAAHKFSVGQYISTDADWTDNAFMASLTDKLITSVTSTTFTFALTQANQGATTETNAGAGITPGDYVLTLPTGGSFFVDEVGIVASTLDGTLTTQPTCRFGTSGSRASLRAADITTLLTAVRSRERYQTLLTDVGEATLACGMTVPAVLNSATSFKIRFYFEGIFVENE